MSKSIEEQLSDARKVVQDQEVVRDLADQLASSVKIVTVRQDLESIKNRYRKKEHAEVTQDRKRTPHPAVEAGCTPEQVAAFEKVCDGLDLYVSHDMADNLISKGLVKKYVSKISCSVRYHVIHSIHAQWLTWCQETGRNTEG